MRVYVRILVFCVVLCAVFVCTVYAAGGGRKQPPLERALEKRRADDAERKKLVSVLNRWKDKLSNRIAENDRNLAKAQELERKRLERAERYYHKEDYKKAKRYYKKARDVSFYQWTPDGAPSEKELEDKDFKPSTKKRKYRLATANTAAVFKKLMEIDERVFEADLARRRERADKAFEAGRLSVAYRQYDSVREFARRRSGNALAAKTLEEVKGQRERIIDAVSRPLMLAETALEQKKPGKALDAVEEFETKYASFKKVKDIRKRYNRIAAEPALRKEKRERAAGKLLAGGEAACARGDYLTASRRFATAGTAYKETEAGKTARKKLAAMMADVKIVRTIKLQEAEYECKGLLARAAMLVKAGKPAEAQAVYDTIIEKHPNTPWAVEAAEAKGKLETRDWKPETGD